MSEAAIDKGLVLRAQEGDQRAFEALVMKYQTRVKKLVARFVRSADVMFNQYVNMLFSCIL